MEFEKYMNILIFLKGFRMSDEEDFEEQIRQEKLAESSQDAGLLEHGRTRKDEDGTEYEWDADKQAWFPKV